MQKSLAIVSCLVLVACQRTPEPAAGAATTSNAGSTLAPSVNPQTTPAAPATGQQAGSSAGMPSMGTAPVGTTAGTGGPKKMVYTAPKAWVSAPNPNTFRKATFKVPGPAGDAELAISESGGSLADNIARWEKQFGDAKAKTTSREVNGFKVTVVEVRGTYANSMAMGNVKPQQNSVLLGAIVETDTPTFFKLTGPEKTVDAAKKDFDELIKSFKIGE